MNRRVSIVITLVAALVATVAGALAFQMLAPKAAEKPDPAAELFYQQNLRDATGKMQAMSAHRGKVVVVNFWATWCVPCVQEIPAFSKTHAEVSGRVAFVGLGIDSPDSIAAFDARFKPSYPLLVAGASGTELARAFGNTTGGLPFTVVLGADGRVVASHLGRVDEETLKRWIAPYVGAWKAAAGSGKAGSTL
ncbi:MAG: redoxin family protein [Burkholderiaceae bacterium]